MQPAITKLIRVELLDEPDVVARIEIPDDYIRQLAESIRDTGLIHPLCVCAENGRFKIYDGHCRYLAVKQLGVAEVRCDDYTNTGVPPEQIKVRANLDRKDMSDGEWVVFLAELREKHDYDLDGMMKLTGKSENWIADRMAIYRGHKDVFDALLAGQLNLSQAKVLNRFPAEYLPTYLMHAVELGTPARVLENQHREFKLMNLPTNLPEGSAPVVAPEALPGVQGQEPCAFCTERHSPWTMKYILVHGGCLDTLLRAMKEAGG